MKFQYKNQTSPWIFILTDIEILHLAIKITCHYARKKYYFKYMAVLVFI